MRRSRTPLPPEGFFSSRSWCRCHTELDKLIRCFPIQIWLHKSCFWFIEEKGSNFGRSTFNLIEAPATPIRTLDESSLSSKSVNAYQTGMIFCFWMRPCLECSARLQRRGLTISKRSTTSCTLVKSNLNLLFQLLGSYHPNLGWLSIKFRTVALTFKFSNLFWIDGSTNLNFRLPDHPKQ